MGGASESLGASGEGWEGSSPLASREGQQQGTRWAGVGGAKDQSAWAGAWTGPAVRQAGVRKPGLWGATAGFQRGGVHTSRLQGTLPACRGPTWGVGGRAASHNLT